MTNDEQKRVEEIRAIDRLTAALAKAEKRAEAAIAQLGLDHHCKYCTHRNDTVGTGNDMPDYCIGCNGERWEWNDPTAEQEE